MSSSIIVLAAGASRRMGQPKPLLPFNGETCLSLVLKSCLRSRADETILVLGDQADRIRDEAERKTPLEAAGRLRWVVNDRYERGQTSTLKTGLEAASPRSEALVLLPVDHPLVTSAVIDALLERFEAHPRGRTIFIAAHDGLRGHPVLFAGPHRSALLELGDDEPLHDYIRLREGETEQVSTPNPGVVTGMNTPEEYRRLLEIYRANARPRDGSAA